MLRNFAILFLGFFSTMSQASARPCSSGSNNSCWIATNYSHQPADVLCTTSSWTLISVRALSPGAQDSTQFDTGYGDGLGFPEPGLLVTCQASLSNGQQATLTFSTYGWGDRVEIIIEPNQLRATSREYWRHAPEHTVTARLSTN